MCDGKVIFENGRRKVEPRKIFFPARMFDTVKVRLRSLPVFPTKGRVRVIEFVTRLVTKETIVDLGNPEESKDLTMVFALDRVGTGGAFAGFLKGFGLRRGAFGSTMCWDTTDMVVVGCDTESMETVIRRLEQIKGGGVYAIGKEVIAEFPAPLCGELSLKPMEVVVDEIRGLERALKKNGVKWEKPLLTIETLGTPAIPHLRITHHGYVRLKDREELPLKVT
jgi:adenine deaminase